MAGPPSGACRLAVEYLGVDDGRGPRPASMSATAVAACRAPRGQRLLRGAADVRGDEHLRAGRAADAGRRRRGARPRRARRRPGGPRRSASASSASSTSDSRAVLMKLAPGFIRANSLAPKRCRFSAVALACTDTMSESASSAVEADQGRRRPARRRAGIGSCAITVKPSAAARPATCRPTCPRPTRPSMVPGASRPKNSRPSNADSASLPPSAMYRLARGTPADEHQRERDRQLGDRLGVLAGRAHDRDAALA